MEIKRHRKTINKASPGGKTQNKTEGNERDDEDGRRRDHPSMTGGMDASTVQRKKNGKRTEKGTKQHSEEKGEVPEM